MRTENSCPASYAAAAAAAASSRPRTSLAPSQQPSTTAGGGAGAAAAGASSSPPLQQLQQQQQQQQRQGSGGTGGTGGGGSGSGAGNGSGGPSGTGPSSGGTGTGTSGGGMGGGSSWGGSRGEGGGSELNVEGMLYARFAPGGKLGSVEMAFDVMTVMQQLQRAAGVPCECLIVPNSLEAACQRSATARYVHVGRMCFTGSASSGRQMSSVLVLSPLLPFSLTSSIAPQTTRQTNTDHTASWSRRRRPTPCCT